MLVRGISSDREEEMPIFYKGRPLQNYVIPAKAGIQRGWANGDPTAHALAHSVGGEFCKGLYKWRQVGTRRVDFLVEGRVVVKLKVISELESVHLAQAINNLEAFGLLLNFGCERLGVKRL